VGKKLVLQYGEKRFSEASKPVLQVVEGDDPYVWIGNDHPAKDGEHPYCFGTIPLRDLRKLLDRK
jgi:hypothetical protein